MSDVRVWCDGKPAGDAAALSRAFHYGDGVFRTLLRIDGRVLDVDGQLDKLVADAARLGLDADPAGLRDSLARLMPERAARVVKLMLVRAGRGRGYAPGGRASQCWLMQFPAPRYAAGLWERGIVAQRAGITLAEQTALAGIKHLNRLEQVLAYRDADPDADEVILCDARGSAICGGRTNLFAVIGGQLMTPALDRCGVAGRMRERVIALAQQLGIPVLVDALGWDTLLAADEAFVTNSVVGIWPLRRLAPRDWPASGTVTRRLQAALNHPRTESRID